MRPDHVTELNAHQRAVLVVAWLDAGDRLTMSEIARRTGLTFNGAKYMMAALSSIMPITEIDGEWQKVSGVKSDCNRA